jgi:hypothetical protein
VKSPDHRELRFRPVERGQYLLHASGPPILILTTAHQPIPVAAWRPRWIPFPTAGLRQEPEAGSGGGTGHGALDWRPCPPAPRRARPATRAAAAPRRRARARAPDRRSLRRTVSSRRMCSTSRIRCRAHLPAARAQHVTRHQRAIHDWFGVSPAIHRSPMTLRSEFGGSGPATMRRQAPGPSSKREARTGGEQRVTHVVQAPLDTPIQGGWRGIDRVQNAKLISAPTVQPENLSDQKYPAPTPTYSTCQRSP